MAQKLTQFDLLALPSLNNPASGFVSFGAKADGLYQKIGTVESKLATNPADISTLTLSNSTSTSHTHKIISVGESFLTFGGQNKAGDVYPLDFAINPYLNPNRFAFIDPSSIIVEYSRDGGSTWSNYSTLSDAHKINFFNGNGANIQIGGSGYAAGTDYTNYQVRVIINTAGQLYTTLNKFILYVRTNGSVGSWCTIDARLQSNYTNNVDTWVTLADKVSIAGWSGYNVINTVNFSTYGNVTASQYGQVRFTFGNTGYNASYTGLIISKIFGYGGVGWVTPSTMARLGQMYTYDYLKNVTFDAGVYAGGFNTTGDLQANRVISSRLGYFGYYSAAQTQGIWSIGSAYNVSASTTTLGNQYGLAYSYINVGGSSFTNDHQIHFAYSGTATISALLSNGSIKAMGDITARNFIKNGGTSSQFLMADGSSFNKPTTLSGYGITDAAKHYGLSVRSGDLNILAKQNVGAEFYLSDAININGTTQRWHLIQHNITSYYAQLAISAGAGSNKIMFRASGNADITNDIWVELAKITDNVASATKLQTLRTIWGQSFDGSGNVSGALTGVTTISASSTISATTGIFSNLTANYYPKHTATGLADSLIFDNGTNVGIGTNNPLYKLDVNGNVRFTTSIRIGDIVVTYDDTNKALKIEHVTSGTNANLVTTGEITAYS